jgi:hypothetical protein
MPSQLVVYRVEPDSPVRARAVPRWAAALAIVRTASRWAISTPAVAGGRPILPVRGPPLYRLLDRLFAIPPRADDDKDFFGEFTIDPAKPWVTSPKPEVGVRVRRSPMPIAASSRSGWAAAPRSAIASPAAASAGRREIDDKHAIAAGGSPPAHPLAPAKVPIFLNAANHDPPKARRRTTRPVGSPPPPSRPSESGQIVNTCESVAIPSGRTDAAGLRRSSDAGPAAGIGAASTPCRPMRNHPPPGPAPGCRSPETAPLFARSKPSSASPASASRESPPRGRIPRSNRQSSKARIPLGSSDLKRRLEACRHSHSLRANSLSVPIHIYSKYVNHAQGANCTSYS